MKSISKLSVFVFILFHSISIYSQITITEINKIEEKNVMKPQPYDSLKNWEYHEKIGDYKQYIGLKIYLPPFENPKIGSNKTQIPFLFSLNPNLICVDSNFNNIKIIRKTYVPSSGSTAFWKTIQFNKIYTEVYKPFHYTTNEIRDSETHDYYSEVGLTNSSEISNKYFTVLGVLYGTELEAIRAKFKSNLKRKKIEADSIISEFDKSLQNNIETTFWDNNPRKIHVDNKNLLPYKDKCFVLRNELTGDTLYCNDIEYFVLVPYYVKQKDIFKNKKLIYLGENVLGNVIYGEFKSYDTRFIIKSENSEGIEVSKSKIINVTFGSKWTCSEVTLMKAGVENYPSRITLPDDFIPEYKMVYILKNEKDDQISLVDIDGFVEEQNFIKRESNKKLQREQLIAKTRQEEQVRREIKRKSTEKHKEECVNLFGQQNGEMIAQGKVKIGMTKEMCKYAWGNPLRTSKTIIENGTFENWFYWLGYSLNFENGNLIRIEE